MVPLANGTEPLEAVVMIDVLRRAGADVTVASVEKQLSVGALHGVKLVADALISDCHDTAFDLISLPVRYYFQFFYYVCVLAPTWKQSFCATTIGAVFPFHCFSVNLF